MDERTPGAGAMLTLIVVPLFLWYWVSVAHFGSSEAAPASERSSTDGEAIWTLIVGFVLLWVLTELVLFEF